MRKARVLRWVLGGFVLLVLAAEILILVVNLRTRYQAEALLRDARSIKIGESTTDDVLRIVRHYPVVPGGYSSACAADESHSVRIANDTLNRVAFAIPSLRLFGAKPSAMMAMFLLQKGRVCYVLYSFSVSPRASAQYLVAETSEWLFNCDDNTNEDPRRSCYDVGEGLIRRTEKLDVRLSNLANAEERQRSLGFDFSCLTSILGCRRVCQMNPAVWRDYVAKAKKEGWTLPAEEMNDPRCSAIERSGA